MIKKFKNGNIVIDVRKDIKDGNFDIDSFYHDEMFWSDLYFNQVNGYMYLTDQNTQRVYDFSNCYINILIYLKELLEKDGIIKLYPLPKKKCKSILEDLENGY